MKPLPTGKLPAELLQQLLSRHTSRDDAVLLGPSPGEDAAIIDLGDCCLVAATDPITFATTNAGWYAVNVNANDVACCGATPRWFLATLLLPEGTEHAAVETLFEQIQAAATALDVSVIGGHTEITHGLDRPLVIGQMLGTASRDQIITTGGAAVGDDLVLTKSIALEGTALLATEATAALGNTLSTAQLAAARTLLDEPGINVVRDAQVACAAGGVHALHDPTEGGLATGLHELASASGTGLVVDANAIAYTPGCKHMCAALDIDPLGLIASGALLMAVDPSATAAIVNALSKAGIEAHVIGRVTDASTGCRLEHGGGEQVALPHFERDELTKVLG